MEKFLIQKTKK
uniref:Uncharacterized protein n=1 Tax=Medicago truncatula TaxID=3880 RepID=B7FFK3_MEDTR|nr:unknown [Medicago truncatula]